MAAQAWAAAYAQLTAADRESPLGPEDLERLAAAAYLTGRDDQSDELWAPAHREWLRLGSTARAVGCGFWLAFLLLLRGEAAQSGGWLARSQRLLDDEELDCVERGYPLIPVGLRAMAAGDAERGYAAAAEAAKTGDRFHDGAARGIEIMLAANDLEAARTAAEELSTTAAKLDAAYLHATSARATGSILLAEGQARAALDALRQAYTLWQELEAPYETARVRLLMGVACQQLGDQDTAKLHFDAAGSTFQELGAAPDLARVAELSRKAAANTASGLTARELEVLALVAAGKTNQQIAAALIISDHTVVGICRTSSARSASPRAPQQRRTSWNAT